MLVGWNPEPTNITGDMDCYALLEESTAFANASWAKINEIAASGAAPSAWSIGDTKSIQLTNGSKYTVEIIGFNHDDLANGTGKAPITIALKDAVMQSYKLSTTIGATSNWSNYPLRTEIQKFYNLLPEDIRAVVKPVKKKYLWGTAMSTYSYGESTDTVWALSMAEVFGGNKYEDGTHYAERFPDKNSRIKSQSGSTYACRYFLRSATHAYNGYWNMVETNGTEGGADKNYTVYLHFGFCV